MEECTSWSMIDDTVKMPPMMATSSINRLSQLEYSPTSSSVKGFVEKLNMTMGTDASNS